MKQNKTRTTKGKARYVHMSTLLKILLNQISSINDNNEAYYSVSQ